MKLYQVDAFTSTVFRGNPAGVWVGEEFPSVHTMQSIAAEINASETAFIQRQSGATYNIRYFTPTREVPLCGHATLAGAHILHELGYVPRNTPFVFHAAEDDLPISVGKDGIKMTFPVYPISKVASPKYLESSVGAPLVEAYTSGHGWLVARLADEAALREASPDFEAIRRDNTAELIAATAPSSLPGHDFCVRVFCHPAWGIQEDPVTGSANCILAPYWREELQKTTFISHQLSKRGGAMKVAILDDTVEILGKAVTVFTMETAF